MIMSKRFQVLSLPNPLSIGSALLVLLELTCLAGFAQTTVNVSTLAELRLAVQESNQHITMKPGKYTITELPSRFRNFPCSGNNNIIEMTGVYM